MPPRIPTVRPLATAAAASSSSSSTTTLTRPFSTSPALSKMTQRRRAMFRWLKTMKARTLADSANIFVPTYLAGRDQPFPLNPLFRSQPVLSEGARNLIFEKVTQKGEALKAVAAELGVDVRRVAAVVRLKAVEAQWTADVSVFRPFIWCCCLRDEIQHFSISLEDNYMVIHLFIFLIANPIHPTLSNPYFHTH